VNDITFLDYPRQISPGVCGPFDTKREWMEAFAFLGKPPTRRGTKPEVWSFEKTLDIYDIVARFYQNSSYSTFKEEERFHLAHGDLSNYDILIDPDTGAVTGLIDWEMAGVSSGVAGCCWRGMV
jgi:Phosphotransferase enzyme family